MVVLQFMCRSRGDNGVAQSFSSTLTLAGLPKGVAMVPTVTLVELGDAVNEIPFSNCLGPLPTQPFSSWRQIFKILSQLWMAPK